LLKSPDKPVTAGAVTEGWDAGAGPARAPAGA
jgi:hypothetical protein